MPATQNLAARFDHGQKSDAERTRPALRVHCWLAAQPFVDRYDQAGSVRELAQLSCIHAAPRSRTCRSRSSRPFIPSLPPLSLGVCSWSLQVKSIPELKGFLAKLGVNVVQIACGDPHHASWDEGDVDARGRTSIRESS